MTDEVSRFLAVTEWTADSDRKGAELIEQYQRSAVEQWITFGRFVRPEQSLTFAAFLGVLKESPAEAFTKEFITGCLAITEDDERTVEAVLAKSIDLQTLLEVPALRRVRAAFLRACREAARRGSRGEEDEGDAGRGRELIDLSLAMMSEYRDSPGVVLEGFKLLGVLGDLSGEWLARIRDQGHLLRKIAKNFPMPEWLNVVAWNL